MSKTDKKAKAKAHAAGPAAAAPKLPPLPKMPPPPPAAPMPELPKREVTPQQAAAAASLIFGEAAWLMSKSPGHKYLFLADLEWALLPALMSHQFKRFHKDGLPVGLALWAKVTPEVDARLSAGEARLAPADWTGGDIVWVIALLCPTEAENEILDDLAKGPLAQSGFKILRRGEDGKAVVVRVDPRKEG